MKILSVLMVAFCLSACTSDKLTYSKIEKLNGGSFDSQRNWYLERMNKERMIFKPNEFKNAL